MSKLKRALISACIVGVSAGAYIGANYCTNQSTYVNYWIPLTEFVTNINFPLAFVLIPLGYAFEEVTPWLNISHNLIRVVELAMIVPVSAAFWYFFVSEVNARRHGGSLFRSISASTLVQFAIVSLLALVGTVAGVVWLSDSRLQLISQFRFSRIGLGVALQLLPRLALPLWAFILLKVSVREFYLLFNLRKKGE